MGSVINTKSKYLKYSGLSGEPNVYLESEGEKYIRELAFKQRDTDLTVEKHLKQERKFESVHSYLPITEISSGTSNLKDFISYANKTESSQVHNTCNENDTDKINNISCVGRHVRDLALCVKPNSLETRLLRFAIRSNKYKNDTDFRPADHPINHLHTLHDTLFSHLISPNPSVTAKTIARKRRQLLESLSDPIEPKSKVKFVQEKSLWDVDGIIINKVYQKPSLDVRITQAKKKMYKLKNGVITPIELTACDNLDPFTNSDRHDDPSVSLSSNTSNDVNISRYSVEQIMRIPRFSTYSKGNPSRVLYLKNLSKMVNEEDLANLFRVFHRDDEFRPTYRLMRTGRMRGQAFVTFNSIKDAMKALDLVNGIVCKGQPVIIQFGNNSNDQRTIN